MPVLLPPLEAAPVPVALLLPVVPLGPEMLGLPTMRQLSAMLIECRGSPRLVSVASVACATWPSLFGRLDESRAASESEHGSPDELASSPSAEQHSEEASDWCPPPMPLPLPPPRELTVDVEPE